MFNANWNRLYLLCLSASRGNKTTCQKKLKQMSFPLSGVLFAKHKQLFLFPFNYNCVILSITFNKGICFILIVHFNSFCVTFSLLFKTHGPRYNIRPDILMSAHTFGIYISAELQLFTNSITIHNLDIANSFFGSLHSIGCPKWKFSIHQNWRKIKSNKNSAF